MTPGDVARERLRNQRIGGGGLGGPREVVRWMGAVQAQDYLGALWAVGLRLGRSSEAEVERALAGRAIVRTWPLRGTLHFAAAEDVRWMLALLAPRVVAANERRLRRDHGVDEEALRRSRKAVERALRGGGRLSRAGMYRALESSAVSCARGRGLQILWRLALEGLICFGARQGTQQTFVLLEEWVPAARKPKREEALAELAGRYVASHGPATARDFAWWAGLAASDAATALESARPQVLSERIDSRTYWLAGRSIPAARSSAAHLLPAYDEYSVGYSERAAVLHPAHARRPDPRTGFLGPAIVVGARIVGSWKRTLKRDSVLISQELSAPLGGREARALGAATRRYAAFLGLPVEAP